MESAEPAADRHRPLSHRLTALAVRHHARHLDAFEGSAEKLIHVTNHEERLAEEAFIISDGIRVPKIVLAVAAAQS